MLMVCAVAAASSDPLALGPEAGPMLNIAATFLCHHDAADIDAAAGIFDVWQAVWMPELRSHGSEKVPYCSDCKLGLIFRQKC